jgi:oleate hydratase
MKAYLIGGGIASLAAAVYLIRDGQMTGQDIRILAERGYGGSLDAAGTAEQGFSMRGSRMYGAAYVLSYDLLGGIPSLEDPDKSVVEDTFEFYQSTPWDAKARLVADGEIVDISSWGFSDRDRLDLMRLMLFADSPVDHKRIDECFEEHFFSTNFWLMWSSMFGFETWHSAGELRRYLLRLLRLYPDLETMKIIQSTRYNGYDSIVRPLINYLSERGVQLETNTRVTDLDFQRCPDRKIPRRIDCLRNGAPQSIELDEGDLVFVTLGSMSADSTLGSMTSAPELETGKLDGAWPLWEQLAGQDTAFGRPAAFCEHIDQTKWVTFTVTDSDAAFVERMEQFSGNPPGRGGLVTLTSSNWLLTFHLYHPPAFPDQPEGVFVWWGYGLYADRSGNFVDKPMSACTGTEILIELYSHLGFESDIPGFLKFANCIPCMLPYTTSQFMPRSPGDRPQVIPAGTANLAFMGQYCEIPDDVVYTVEYSVHSARLAVNALLGLPDDLPPTYKGLEHPYALVSALKRILK